MYPLGNLARYQKPSNLEISVFDRAAKEYAHDCTSELYGMNGEDTRLQ